MRILDVSHQEILQLMTFYYFGMLDTLRAHEANELYIVFVNSYNYKQT